MKTSSDEEEVVNLISAFIVGVVGGFLFFGGLYLTVNKIGTVRYPALLMILSLFVRLAVLTAGLFLIADGGIKNLLSAMAGILIVRFLLIIKLGPAASSKKGA